LDKKPFFETVKRLFEADGVFDEKEASVLEELAEAGVQKRLEQAWIPAFAGMTSSLCLCSNVPFNIQRSIKGGSPSCDKDGVTGEMLKRNGVSVIRVP